MVEWRQIDFKKTSKRFWGDKMIPIIGTIRAWTVIWNLTLIGITGGAWLGVLIVWALCKFVFGKKSWHFSAKKGGFAIFAGPLLFQKWRKLTKISAHFLFLKTGHGQKFLSIFWHFIVFWSFGQFCGQKNCPFAHFSKHDLSTIL